MKQAHSPRRKVKLGSLQLSIEAIVVLIIAITVLGLGLSFIRKLFTGTTEKLAGISEQLSEEDRRAIEQSQQEITFLTSELKVSGKDLDINFGIRNNRKQEVTFQLQDNSRTNLERAFYCYDLITDETQKREDLRGQGKFIKFETFPTISIKAGRSAIIPLKIQVEAEAPPTVYQCRLDLKIIEEPTGTQLTTPRDYSTKEFTIVKQ
ncbi:hypothetical protein HY641_05035 [Candidatus Woesearchaeota archaeon]|nr:hypothetical protein [Candidatus Woesearchaeota archaeon]